MAGCGQSGASSRWRQARLRLSVRYKILGLLVAMVATAVVSYLLLAVSLFTRDKLAYVYDLNATLVRTLGEEVEAAAATTVDRLVDFADAYAAAGERKARATELVERVFARQPDLLRLELWQQTRDGQWQRTQVWQERTRLAGFNIDAAALDKAQHAVPVAFTNVLQEKVLLQNTSAPPDLALLTLSVLAPERRQVVVATLIPERFLRIFGASDIYTAFLVDRGGRVLVHPDPEMVTSHASMLGWSIVREAIERRPRRAVRSFRGQAGEELIGAFSRLDSVHASVVMAVPKRQALAAARQLTERSELFAVGILCVCVVASVFFSRRLTAPLRRLEEATLSVSRGEFDVAVQAHSGDEVGRLSVAFNRMAEGLLDRDRRLEETHRELLQSAKLAVVGEMAAGISHEVKNPMVGMRGFAQLGRTCTSLDEAREYFELIERETGRAAAILENLLAFAKQRTITYSTLQINAVVEGAIRLVRHQLQTQGVQLHVELAKDAPHVFGDSNQLQQVLLNLFINAQHAMESAESRQLFVSTRAADGAARITVRDTGCGMDDDTKAKLFRAFVTTKERGTGLGLSVSQRIVRAHGGRIAVDSELGRGTSFTVYLPVAKAAHGTNPNGGGTAPEVGYG